MSTIVLFRNGYLSLTIKKAFIQQNMNQTKSLFAKSQQNGDNIITVQVEYDGNVYNSTPSTSGNFTHPVWDHTFSIFLTDPEENILLKIMSEGVKGSEIIAESQIPVYELCNLKTTVRNLFPLSKRRSPAGEIYLEGKFSPNQLAAESNSYRAAGPDDRY